jgi:hypothetical protein
MLTIAKHALRVLLRSVGLEIRRLPLTGFPEHTYSNLDEQSLIRKYLDQLVVKSRYCVDIGASDGVAMSNSFALYKEGWGGIAVECDAGKFSSLAGTYVNFRNINLAKCTITPENILPLLSAFDIPEGFGFLTLDIDGYDYFVLDQILTKYRPTLICAEINEKIPPPVKFTVKWKPEYTWHGDHFYGQSISQLHMLCTRHDYALVELHYNSVFLIPIERSPKHSLTAEEAYRTGYLNRTDRKEKFPWNDNMEDLLHMQPEQALSFIHGFFDKYKGMFDCSI